MGNENIRNIGFDTDITGVKALIAQAIQDATPVLSDAIDVRTYPRARILLVAASHEVTGTTHTMAFTVTECATTDGSYTAATTSGTLTASAATDVLRIASIKRNAAKPFIKITATGSNADVDVLVDATVLFITPSV